MNEPTNRSVISLIAPFFPNEWGPINPENVTTREITSGTANRITTVSRKQIEQNSSEPLKLLIRRKRRENNDQLQFNTESSNAIIAYEMSRRGLGPKLYGLISNGTIQEYLESHTLSLSESFDPGISKNIALSLANVHAIKSLPLVQNIHEEYERLQKYWSQEISDRIQNRELENTFSNVDTNFFMNFDFKGNAEWMVSVFDRLKSRMRKNFILNDMNYENCLILDKNDDEKSNVFLIDYDLAHYDYRGKDLGCHFFNRIMNYAGEDSVTYLGVDLPSAEERIRFLTVYQQEIKRLNLWDDFDEDGIDSIDNLLIESLIGMTHFTLFWPTFAIYNSQNLIGTSCKGAIIRETFLRKFLQLKTELEQIVN